MKKKLALLMAAIMTVAMVPMTAFASTKLNAVDQISTGIGDDHPFTSRVELSVDDDEETVDPTVKVDGYDGFEVELELTNGEFAKDPDDEDKYVIESAVDPDKGILAVDVTNETTATIVLRTWIYNKSDVEKEADACVLPITAYALDAGDVIATFTSNVTNFEDVKDVIATAYDGDVTIESEGVVTFVEDSSEDVKNIKDITITGLTNGAISAGEEITLKLKGNYEFNVDENGWLYDTDGSVDISDVVTALNDSVTFENVRADEDELHFTIRNIDPNQVPIITIGGFAIRTTKDCDPGDTAKVTISSKDFDSNTIEVARMVEEAVTYTVEDDDLPVIWAGKDYTAEDETNTLEVAIEENTGDILNTSRKATFTFPEGIEVVDIEVDDVEIAAGGLVEGEKYANYQFEYEIDENVVTIWNYGEGEESDATDMKIKFILNAAPTFEGDVDVALGGEFDDVELTVATVKAPYTVEAKTSEVLIDYRYVPVNEIVITEAEEGILVENDVIMLQVEKMDFEDAGTYEVTSGDIEVDVTINDGEDNVAQLEVEVTDDSTEASTITISGLELYLDRTLPVGGYALENVGAWGDDEDVYGNDRENNANNILWENSSTHKNENVNGYDVNGIFEYDAVTVNDSYVEVVTAGRDQDDSSTTRKIVITIGATTMAVGTETVTLDTPAYINAENYTELPLRAVSEAFGATVGWDDASRTVTIMMGQRIVSMTIGSKTMYINGTPVAMNTAPEITNERTFVPVRDLANALGITKIDWNEASATVTLN